nr:hypothetical protein [Tanacetum cinerariifolium]
MEKGFLIPKGIGRRNGAKEKLKNVTEIPIANKEYNDDFMKERADIVGKEMKGLNSSPTDVVVSKESICVVKERLNNTVYEFFMGKLMAYPIVILLRTTMLMVNSQCVIDLKKWTPYANIMKEDVCNIPLWVTFHDISIPMFTKDELSVIATKLGLIKLKTNVGGKLMLVDDDEKPLNKVESDPVDSDIESEVELAYDETAQFMTSRGENDASLYEGEDYDIYDTYDFEGLTKQQLTFYDMMDINLHGHGRR